MDIGGISLRVSSKRFCRYENMYYLCIAIAVTAMTVALIILTKRLVFYEVKRNNKRVSLPTLKQKAEKIIRDFPDYNADFQRLSLDDM
jgi:cell division protein FtsL